MQLFYAGLFYAGLNEDHNAAMFLVHFSDVFGTNRMPLFRAHFSNNFSADQPNGHNGRQNTSSITLHAFTWKILSPAPTNKKERKSLEAFFIALNAPSLNNQIETKTLLLFRNGIT